MTLSLIPHLFLFVVLSLFFPSQLNFLKELPIKFLICHLHLNPLQPSFQLLKLFTRRVLRPSVYSNPINIFQSSFYLTLQHHLKWISSPSFLECCLPHFCFLSSSQHPSLISLLLLALRYQYSQMFCPSLFSLYMFSLSNLTTTMALITISLIFI